jgi:hypothetical protein
MPDWTFAATWQVGDELNADNLNSRIMEPNTLLLRRPLTVLHSSVNLTIANNTTTLVSFDTIDQDDDGMVVTGLPANTFAIQRHGVYQIWFAGTYLSNAAAGDIDCNMIIDGVTASRRWDVCARMFGTPANTVVTKNMVGTIILNEGQTISITHWQDTGASMTVSAQENTPRVAIFWEGLT